MQVFTWRKCVRNRPTPSYIWLAPSHIWPSHQRNWRSCVQRGHRKQHYAEMWWLSIILNAYEYPTWIHVGVKYTSSQLTTNYDSKYVNDRSGWYRFSLFNFYPESAIRILGRTFKFFKRLPSTTWAFRWHSIKVATRMVLRLLPYSTLFRVSQTRR
jgi:hypothetical protein